MVCMLAQPSSVARCVNRVCCRCLRYVTLKLSFDVVQLGEMLDHWFDAFNTALVRTCFLCSVFFQASPISVSGDFECYFCHSVATAYATCYELHGTIAVL